MTTRLSIVIPAYNEEVLLPACLASVMPQATARQAEVIVIDNHSTDSTAAVATRHGARVVHEAQRGYVHALRRGFAEARGEIVAVIDADSIALPGWVDAILDAFRDPRIVASSGPIRFVGAPLLTGLRECSRYYLWGANMAVRRSVYEQSGGFHPEFHLDADLLLTKTVRRYGRIAYLRAQAIATSSRRFQSQPLRQGILYSLNALAFFLFRKPIWRDFPAIRTPEQELKKKLRMRRVTLSAASALLFIVYAFFWPTTSVFGQITAHVNTDAKLVALTFDDGPNGEATRHIVDILAAKGVPATFFELGSRIAADPSTAQYVASHQFVIENHSWSHSFRLPLDGPNAMKKELTRTSALILQTTGKMPTLFRPPHGLRSPVMLYESRRDHLHMVDWSVDPQDYLTNNPTVIADRVIDSVRPGRIVLMHDGVQDGPLAKTFRARTGTIAALPTIIDALRSKGYQFVTVPELLRVQHRDDGFFR